MSKETFQMPIERYRDNAGNPTCAFDFPNGEFCKFLASQRFGTYETCLLAPPGQKGLNYPVWRRESGKGTLIPGDWCPIWTKEEKEKKS